MADLSTNLCNLKLKNPVILGAGPETKNLHMVKKSIESGCGAVVTRSIHPSGATDRSLRELYYVINPPKGRKRDAVYSYCSSAVFSREFQAPENASIGSGPAPTLEQWADEVSKMTALAHKEGVILITSIGMITQAKEIWINQARMMEQAGADAIELHLGPTPVMDAGRLAQLNTELYVEEVIRAVKSTVGIPVIAKLTIDSCDLISIARRARDAGADGVTVTGRFRSLYIDTLIESQPIWHGPHGIGGPWVLPILCEKIFALKMRRDTALPDLAVTPSGGVACGEDIARLLLVGADGAQICSQVLVEGFTAVSRILDEFKDWMRMKDYSRIEEFQGKANVVEALEYLYSDLPYLRSEINRELCNNCGRCAAVCTDNAITESKGGIHHDRSRCAGCYLCSYVCPRNAISMTI